MSNPWTAEVQEKPWFSRADWLKRHEGLLQQTRTGGINVLFLGDSITEGWLGGGRAVWDREFAPLGAADFGIGGDEVQHVLWRVLNGEVEGLQPKVIPLLIGTNNVGNVGHAAADVAFGIAVLVKALRDKLPAARILLHAVFPRDPKPETPFRRELAAVNARLAALHDGQQVFFVDFCGTFMETDATIAPAIMPDYLHLSPEGYARWAAALTPEVRRFL